MATNLNFKGFVNEPPAEGNGSGRPPANFPLARQSSIYSLTLDEFQSTLGKDFGSMNMDELLKNIWNAEETQGTASSAAAIAGGGAQDGGNQGGYLQRQGSLTLPRTLSLKTVDEVWKAMSMECNNTESGASIPQAQRQPTLGEMTLEEFLVRAGVVREETQLAGKPNPGGFLGDLAQINNTGYGVVNFQQPSRGAGLVQPQVSLQTPNLPLNVNGVRSSQPQIIAPQMTQQMHQQQQQQLIFPKQAAAVSYAASIAIPTSTQLASPGMRNGIVGLADPTMTGKLGHGSAMQGQGGGMGIVGVGGAGLGVTGSPAALSSDGMNSNGDTSSVSPGPYMFNGGLRGRKGNHGVEKVIERRQRRMIKNRESAARSRARKQAYTMELEQELAKLKEENEELRRKQAETMEMQKNQAMEMMDEQRGIKRRCLRRTQTGPW